jgi:DNA-binding response OmpR family regulator
MLPDGTGIELCNYIKTNNADTVVILQTAKSQIEDKLSWFHEGADDYLTKPYDLRELEARIKILIKGKPNIEDTVINNQIFQCNLTSMQIWKEGIEIHCTHHERILIKLLLEQPWEAISRAIIADYIRWSEWLWQAENNIDVLVSWLRKKLWKDIIQTIKWFGYKIIL